MIYTDPNFETVHCVPTGRICELISAKMAINLRVSNTWFNKPKRAKLERLQTNIDKHVIRLFIKQFRGVVTINSIDRVFGSGDVYKIVFTRKNVD